MNKALSTDEMRNIFNSLSGEYERLTSVRDSLYNECNQLLDYIDNQVKQIQSLTVDFDKLLQEFATVPPSPPPPAPLSQLQPLNPPIDDNSSVEVGESDQFELVNLIPDPPHPLTFSLVAEILDVTVISSTAFSPDTKHLAIGSDKTLRVYNIEVDDFILQYQFKDGDEETPNHLRSLVWTADGSKIICGGEDHHIRVFNFPEGSLLASFEAGNGEVFQLQISHNSTFLAAVTGDGTLSLWDINTFEYRASLQRKLTDDTQSGVATSLSISDDDRIIAVGYCDSYIGLWDISKKQLCCQPIQCHSSGVYSVKFLANSTKLATSSLDNTIKLWSIKDNFSGLQCIKTLVGHTNFVLSLAVDPTGRWLLSGSKDLTVKLTDIDIPAMVYSIKAHSNSVITVAFNTGNNLFCTGSGDHSVKIWSYTEEDNGNQ